MDFKKHDWNLVFVDIYCWEMRLLRGNVVKYCWHGQRRKADAAFSLGGVALDAMGALLLSSSWLCPAVSGFIWTRGSLSGLGIPVGPEPFRWLWWDQRGRWAPDEEVLNWRGTEPDGSSRLVLPDLWLQPAELTGSWGLIHTQNVLPYHSCYQSVPNGAEACAAFSLYQLCAF